MTNAAGTSVPVLGFGLTIDTSGNVYQAGQIYKDATFGETTFTNPGMFVSKYDPAGQLDWVIEDGSPSAEGWSIGLDASNNVYVLCGIGLQAVFGGQTITNPSSALALVKYDSNGTLIWAKNLCWGSLIYPSGMAVDARGNCYFDATSWGNGAHTDLTNFTGGALVGKCDSDGNLAWIKSFGSSSNSNPNISDLALGGTNGIYVLGHFKSSFVIDGTTLSGGSADNVFLADFTSDGRLQWVKQSTGTNSTWSNRLAVDASGRSIITGVFTTSASFDNLVLSNAVAGNYYYLTKYDSAGNALWAQSLGMGGSRSAVTVDSSGNCYAAAELSGNTNIFSKFDAGGDLLWTKIVPNGMFMLFQLAADSVGNCFFSGSLYNQTTFDGQTLGSAGNNDALLGKINTSTPPPLNLVPQGDSVQLSWPDLAAGFHLESADHFDPALSWTSNAATVNTLGLTNVATVSTQGGQMFFRLKRP